jgi:hypothetical protein
MEWWWNWIRADPEKWGPVFGKDHGQIKKRASLSQHWNAHDTPKPLNMTALLHTLRAPVHPNIHSRKSHG